MSRIIVQVEGPIVVDDVSCPVIIQDEKNQRAYLVKDLSDAEAFTGVPRAEVVSMADSEEKTRPQKEGFSFSWPDLKAIKKNWDYPVDKPVSRGKRGTVAVPVAVILTPPPGARQGPKLYYRSITSCCHAWGISKETFDKVANQHLGWKEALPQMMASIRTGVSAPKDYYIDGGADDEPLFGVKQTAKGFVVKADKLDGRRFDRVQDIPEAVLANSDWGRRRAA